MRSTLEAYQLMHEGAIALAEAEHNGIRIDTDRLRETKAYLTKKQRQATQWLTEHEYYQKHWKKAFGAKANLSSDTQLAHVLFTSLKKPVKNYTPSGAPKTDAASLQELADDQFVKAYLRFAKIEKALGTFITGIEREVDANGFLHPFFNLHLARTYRSSSDSPNFQNFPVRDKWMSQLIRSLFVSREGYRLTESDFSGVEVHGAAWYHRDPVMLGYLEDKSKDMHRDMAAKCFMVPTKEVTKTMRYCGKNKFVFPAFYGDYYLSITRSLWDSITSLRLDYNGVPLTEHLRSKGIESRGACAVGSDPVPGTFEHHVKEVEHWFWKKRFKVYDQWRRDWYSSYVKNGGFRTLTGFWITGDLRRNEVINFPVQGVAFHCLLWSFIQLSRELRKRRMKTKLVGQIHDSIVADVYEPEMETYLKLVKEIMTERLPDHWRFIITKLEIEVEAAPTGGSWFDKAVMEI